MPKGCLNCAIVEETPCLENLTPDIDRQQSFLCEIKKETPIPLKIASTSILKFRIKIC